MEIIQSVHRLSLIHCFRWYMDSRRVLKTLYDPCPEAGLCGNVPIAVPLAAEEYTIILYVHTGLTLSRMRRSCGYTEL
jgi:hypothetical protein